MGISTTETVTTYAVAAIGEVPRLVVDVVTTFDATHPVIPSHKLAPYALPA